MLFSEPKIPQCVVVAADRDAVFGFSALQRAENSSMCSIRQMYGTTPACFSALQRAENSSISEVERVVVTSLEFQCSSASRKFLNLHQPDRRELDERVSVLFSEPKIPQYVRYETLEARRFRFQCSSASRKFLNALKERFERRSGVFQCSSASRKFLNVDIRYLVSDFLRFQCSSASRKFLN